MHALIDESAAIARSAAVSRQMHRNAALDQRRGERFGGKQMPPGSAGRHKDGRAAAGKHQTALAASTVPLGRCACGRSRVSAISMPMP